MSLTRRTIVATLATAALAATTVVAVNAMADTQPKAVNAQYGAAKVEAQDPNREFRAMPALQQVSWKNSSGTHKRLIRSVSIRPDGVPPVAERMQYQDGSGKWQDAKDARTGKPLMESSDAQYAMASNVFTDSAGQTVALETQAHKDSKGRYILRWITKDGGVSWTPSRTPLDFNGGSILDSASGQAFQKIVTLPDGSRLLPFYVAHPVGGGKYKFSAHLLVGDADATKLKRAATVFSSNTIDYSESSVARRSDGKLLMITRYETERGGFHYSKLLSRVTTSAVNSAADVAKAKWAAPTAVKVPGAADADVVSGVAPILSNMDSGVLMLVFGRPRNKIAFSTDGGTTWTTAHSFYDNMPTNCKSGYGGNPCSALGSSGYMGVAVTSPTTAVIMGDNCQAGWGCKANYKYPHGTTDLLWTATVTLK
ncbi:MAG TPA: exo-alpha-sialidase [Stackebrandtia sp.]|jgi:hypothetical protein|uniref:exo-alpha-sialidase n=1 Tax=Stackebrandtia sp. TaxID=2023065 RepID=UPI002D319EC6|nr:exo-alpha-sialidase [Stackebrandtia sp.]HZE40872.1 exo-alpha-sialidase [Stackebrandtia sp.]